MGKQPPPLPASQLLPTSFARAIRPLNPAAPLLSLPPSPLSLSLSLSRPPSSLQEDILAFCEVWDRVNTNKDPSLMDEVTFRKLLRVLPQSIVHYDKVATSHKQLMCLLYEVDIQNFRTAKLTFLGKDENHFAQKRKDGLLHFHRVLLALNRVILLNKDLGETFTTRSDHAAISQHSAVSTGHINAFRIQYRWRTRRELRQFSKLLKLGQVVLDTMDKEHIGAKFKTEHTEEEGTLSKTIHQHVPIHKLHLLGTQKHSEHPKHGAHAIHLPHLGAQAWSDREAELSAEEKEEDTHNHALELLSRQDRGADDMIPDGIDHLDKMRRLKRQVQAEAGESSPGSGSPGSRRRSPKKATALSPSGVAKRPAGKPKQKRWVRCVC